jgi:hypothetical protein
MPTSLVTGDEKEKISRWTDWTVISKSKASNDTEL